MLKCTLFYFDASDISIVFIITICQAKVKE